MTSQCVKDGLDELFGDNLSATATATTIAKELANRVAGKVLRTHDAKNIFEHFTAKGGLMPSMISFFNKLGNGTATSADYGSLAANVLDLGWSIAKLAGSKNPVIAAGLFATTLAELIAPFAPCLIPDDPEPPQKDEAERTTSPLIIDMDRNGIATFKIRNGVFFDLDGNGFKEKAAWLNSGDALLAIDLNGNGLIDSGFELFGNNTKLHDGSNAENGFRALAELDSNDDKIFDDRDQAWSAILLWRDVLNDGVSQPEEISKLMNSGITAISLEYSNTVNVDASGNKHLQVSKVTWANGGESAIEDIWFEVDLAKTIHNSEMQISDELSAILWNLPYVEGFGNVVSLHEAMALNPALLAMVQSYVSSNASQRSAMLNELIYTWTGSNEVDPNSRDPKKIYGHVMDARQLVTLEHLTGSGYMGVWCWGENDPNPHGQAAPKLIAEFNSFADYVAAKMSAQIDHPEVFASLFVPVWNETSQQYSTSWDSYNALASKLLSEGKLLELRDLIKTGRSLGNFTKSFRTGYELNAQLVSASNAELAVVLKSTVLVGTAGDDRLTGTAENELISGEEGADTLYGGTGDDQYIFDKNFGADRIYDTAGTDSLIFGSEVVAGSIKISRDLTSIYLTELAQYGNQTPNKIQIDNFFDLNGNLAEGAIEQIRFSDGETWSLSDILLNLTPVPTETNDFLYYSSGGNVVNTLGGNDLVFGGGGNDTINGGEGEDEIFGDDGDDYLIGGAGDDTITGGNGSDVYRYAANFGSDVINSLDYSLGRQDVIEFDSSVSWSSISVSNSGGDLLITDSQGNQIKVLRHFIDNGKGANSINEVRFADAAVWNQMQLREMALQGTSGDDVLLGYSDSSDVISGGAGHDSLFGGGGNDFLEGGAGNDRLIGEQGNDTYSFSTGFGLDRIENNDWTPDSIDVVKFVGVQPSKVKLKRVGEDLLLYTDQYNQVTIAGHFYAESAGWNAIDKVIFDDGTVWDFNKIQSDALLATEDDDFLIGYKTDDTISGLGGDDTLNGMEGNDVLDGGAGNDRLTGGRGNNRYLFGIGDGQDVITSGSDDTAGKTNNLVFKAGIGVNDIVLRQIHSAFASSDMEVSIAGTSDKITIQHFMFNDTIGHAANPVQCFEFADGTKWTLDEIRVRLFAGTAADDVLRGTSVADSIGGAAGNDRISGGAGVDTLSGGDGDDWLDGQQDNDILLGGDGNDYLHGCDGDDILDGGAGNDRLIGNAGTNIYRFGRGDGADIVLANDQGAGTFGTLELKSGVAVSDITLKQVGDDGAAGGLTALQVSINGTTDTITLNSFFQGDDTGNIYNSVEAIKFADGTLWDMSAILAHLYSGTTADDVIRGTKNDDVIHGADGNDTIRGADGTDAIYGDAGNDTLYGDAGNDQLFGGAGADVLDGGAGADTLTGNAGDDIYVVDDVADQVVEAANEGNDTIRSAVSYTISNNVESLELTGTTNIDATGSSRGDALVGNSGDNRLDGLDGDDTLQGGAGNDALLGGIGNDTLDGGSGLDSMSGGVGNDTYIVDQSDDIVIEVAGEGHDGVNSTASQYTLADNVERLLLLAGAGNGTGNALDNELIGNDGSNWLDGGAGADRMVGGLGDDTYVVDSAGDVVVENADEGDDTVISSISYVLGDTLENLTLNGTANINATGNAGHNSLVGNSGNNRIDGGAGGDQMSGGAGNDTYVVDSTNDWVNEDAGTGIDTVERSCETNLILADNVENLILTGGALTGHGNGLGNVITGNAGNNSSLGLDGNDTIYGLAGNDSMWGGEGNDILYGGIGNDYLDGGNGSDRLEGGDGNDQLGGGAGVDTLIGGLGDDKYVLTLDGNTDIINNADGGFDGIFFGSTISKSQLSFKREGDNLLIIVDGNDGQPAARVVNHFLGGNYAIDYVQPSAPGSYYLTTAEINAKVLAYGTGYDTVMDGTESADTSMVGTSSKDWVRGLGGDDQIFGNSGDDLLQGGDGNDYLAGGLGNDTNTGNDRLEGGNGNDTLVGQDGDDTLIGGVGNDTYMWDSGLDIIDNTGGGTDTLFFPSSIPVTRLTFSRDGDDLLILVDNNPTQGVRVLKHFLGGDSALDNVYQNGGSGYNTTQMNQKAAMAGYDNLVQGTSSSQTLNGTSGKDLMYGAGGNDIMNGAAGDDRLLGESGNDTLYGGLGTDKLEGGFDDDTYTIDDTLDLVIENASEGNDLVNASVSYTLTENVERLTLTGTSAINGSGNALDNTLTGNSAANMLTGGAGNDTLDGGAGNDTLIGGTGDDTFVVDAIGDLVTEAANEGTDTVKSNVTYSLGNDVENLILTGTTAINGTGNALDNVLTGNSGNNALVGNAGNDTFEGGAGTDTLTGGIGNDIYRMGRGFGADTVIENDAIAGNFDVASFLSGVAYDQLWFQKPTSTNDLKISIIGTTDSLTIKSWYSGSQYQVEQIQTANGYNLTAAKVQTLVSKMATMTKPTGTTLTSSQRSQLASTFASTWTSGSQFAGRSMNTTAMGSEVVDVYAPDSILRFAADDAYSNDGWFDFGEPRLGAYRRGHTDAVSPYAGQGTATSRELQRLIETMAQSDSASDVHVESLDVHTGVSDLLSRKSFGVAPAVRIGEWV